MIYISLSRALRDADPSAPRTRRLAGCASASSAQRAYAGVKLTLAAAAWLLMCVYLTYDIAPTILSGGKGEVFRPWWSYTWGFLVFPAAIALGFLALQPTDAILVRIGCVVGFGVLCLMTLVCVWFILLGFQQLAASSWYPNPS